MSLLGNLCVLLQQITVPVTIEHPPPEYRSCDNQGDEAGQHQAGGSSGGAAASLLMSTPSGLVRQETVHTDSGLDTEEIATASPPTSSRTGLEEADVVKMVLVRDVGIQVCGDSPKLNMTKKFHEINPLSRQPSQQHGYQDQQEPMQQPQPQPPQELPHHPRRSSSSTDNYRDKPGDDEDDPDLTSRPPKPAYSTEILF